MKKVRGLSSSIWVLCILTFSIASGAGVRLPSAPAGQEASPMNMEAIGPRVGAAVPEFTLPDKDGRPRTLRSLLGPQGMMLVFSRSADWWPYCKTQLVELQSRVDDLRRRGLGLAVVTYDSQETLRTFAAARGITFPLLSDVGSKVITAYGLLNAEVDRANRAYGVPHPGTLILDAKGRVTARFFEPAYQTRNTVSSIIVRLGEALDGGRATQASKLTTRHLEALAYTSDQAVAPGHRFSLVLEVTPRPRMHIYAPGRHSYRPIRLTLQPVDDLRVYPLQLPPPETYHFVPLDERVPVYMKPFRLVQDVELRVTPATRALASGRDATLTLEGLLEYQACDDEVCFLPERVPVRWTVKISPLAR